MEFLLLGPLEVRDGDGPIPLGGAKQRALLAFLLLHANEVVSRDRLIDGLWGGQPPTTAAHTVETYVSRLRRALHETGSSAALIARPPGYMLRIDPEDLDLHRFRRLARDGRRAHAERSPEVAAELLRKALALFRGPPLDDVAFFPFAQAKVGRLQEMRLAALEDRIDADLDTGRRGELVEELDALVSAHPLRERLHAQLMLALYRAGRQADALEAYRAARRYLADELGVHPGASLRRLEQAILEHDASLDAAPTGPEPVLADSASRVEPAAAIVAAPPIAPAAEGQRPPSGHASVPAAGAPRARSRAFRCRPRRLVIAMAALVLLLASLAVGIASVLHHDATAPKAIRVDAVGIIDPDRGAIVGEVPLRASPRPARRRVRIGVGHRLQRPHGVQNRGSGHSGGHPGRRGAERDHRGQRGGVGGPRPGRDRGRRRSRHRAGRADDPGGRRTVRDRLRRGAGVGRERRRSHGRRHRREDR